MKIKVSLTSFKLKPWKFVWKRNWTFDDVYEILKPSHLRTNEKVLISDLSKEDDAVEKDRREKWKMWSFNYCFSTHSSEQMDGISVAYDRLYAFSKEMNIKIENHVNQVLILKWHTCTHNLDENVRSHNFGANWMQCVTIMKIFFVEWLNLQKAKLWYKN